MRLGRDWYLGDDARRLAVAGAAMLVWNIISWRFPFFWDSVLHSKTATWYLETGFSQITVPEQLDAGHPPGFNLYLALVWKLLGRSLWVAHAAMLPFLALVLVQFNGLLKWFLFESRRGWAMLLLFCEPTFFTQAGMVSADIALLGGCLLALNAVLNRNRLLLVLGLLLMAAVSFRGILMVGLIAAIDFVWAWWDGARRIRWKAAVPYALVGLVVVVWLWVHWRAVGWVMSPPAETYGGQRQVLGLAGMARNVALMGWRVMDFGRIALWLLAAVGLVHCARRFGWRRLLDDKELWAMVMVFAGLGLLFMPISNPPGHRYFLLGYALLVIVAINGTGRGVVERRWMWLWRPLVALALVTGHLWIYPRGVAQGWDASLAHLPGFGLQDEVDSYLTAKGVAPSEVCADFPWLHAPEDTRLVPARAGGWWRNYLEEKDCPWVVASNLNNGFTDADWAAFDAGKDWRLDKEFRSGRIWMRVYQRVP